jgi:Uma2 family endonuclease
VSTVALPAISPPPSPPVPALTTRDLFERLGEVPLYRICFDPAPGTATEQHVQEIHDRTNRLFELVDGILVEKGMGVAKSFLAGLLICFLNAWVLPRNLGAVLSPDGMLRLRNSIRIPDVSFIPCDRFPGRQVDPNTPVPRIAPDLAVEVLSASNTASEMAVKRQEYFTAGTRLVWIIDPVARTVDVFTSATASTLLQQTDTLDGGAVLPGFTLPLAQLFAELDPH